LIDLLCQGAVSESRLGEFWRSHFNSQILIWLHGSAADDLHKGVFWANALCVHFHRALEQFFRGDIKPFPCSDVHQQLASGKQILGAMMGTFASSQPPHLSSANLPKQRRCMFFR
jgi:hypothetical protein